MTSISLKEYLKFITRGEIPPAPPHISEDLDFDNSMEYYKARKTCISQGMWAIVEKQWVLNLAKWIDNRSCLEVMAGAGWLSKALSEENIAIDATDNYHWQKNIKRVYPVQNISALDAARISQHDILIISWPPYGSHDIVEVSKAWGRDRPIVYIGEGPGGCNAPDEFFESFKESSVSIDLPTWSGIHDRIWVGSWSND